MPNRTQPEFWNHDVAINSLSRDAELLFRKLDLFRQDDHRFPIIPSPQMPSNLHAALYYLRKGVRLTDVARWLDEIQKAGAIVVRDSERGWYGEIVERLRYNAEDFAKGASRCGPRKARIEQAEQANLPLPPMSVLRPAQTQAEKSKPYDYEYVNDNDPESARCAPAKSPAPMRAPAPMMNRSDAAGGESKRVNPKFQRSPDALVMSPLGKRLGTFLGRMQMAEECVYRGAYWQRILSDDPDVLCELLDQGERCASEMPDGKTRAKFLSKRLKERKAA
jgi:hypothetical protein